MSRSMKISNFDSFPEEIHQEHEGGAGEAEGEGGKQTICMLLVWANACILQGDRDEAGEGPLGPEHHHQVWQQQEPVVRSSAYR